MLITRLFSRKIKSQMTRKPIKTNKNKRTKGLAKLILMGQKIRGNSELIYENYKNIRTSIDTINFHFKLEAIRFSSWFHEFKISKFTDILNYKIKKYVVTLTIYFCSLALIYFETVLLVEVAFFLYHT